MKGFFGRYTVFQRYKPQVTRKFVKSESLLRVRIGELKMVVVSFRDSSNILMADLHLTFMNGPRLESSFCQFSCLLAAIHVILSVGKWQQVRERIELFSTLLALPTSFCFSGPAGGLIKLFTTQLQPLKAQRCSAVGYISTSCRWSGSRLFHPQRSCDLLPSGIPSPIPWSSQGIATSSASYTVVVAGRHAISRCEILLQRPFVSHLCRLKCYVFTRSSLNAIIKDFVRIVRSCWEG